MSYFHEIQCVLGDVWELSFKRLHGLRLWNSDAPVVWIILQGLYVVIDQIAEGLLDQVELVEVWVAWQQWLSWEELAKDTANCPDVNWRAVLCVTNEKLRRSVPTCRYILCEVFILNWKNTSQFISSLTAAQFCYCLNGSLPNILANPKSHNLTTFCFVIRIFSGLTSLWIHFKRIEINILSFWMYEGLNYLHYDYDKNQQLSALDRRFVLSSARAHPSDWQPAHPEQYDHNTQRPDAAFASYAS